GPRAAAGRCRGLRCALRCGRPGRLDPVHGAARREVPAGPVPGHRRTRTGLQRTRAGRVAEPGASRAGHGRGRRAAGRARPRLTRVTRTGGGLAAGAGPVPAGHLRRGCRRGPVRAGHLRRGRRGRGLFPGHPGCGCRRGPVPAGHLRRGRRCPRCGWFAPVTTPGKPTVGQGWSMTDADITPEAALVRFVEGLGLVITTTGTRGEYVVGETPDELASAGIQVCLDDELLVEYLRRLDETPDATAGLSP